MSTIQLTHTYRAVTCCHTGCGIDVVMDDGFYAARQRDGEWWYCLNGHVQHFTENTETRLRAQLDQAKADAQWYRNRAARVESNLTIARRQVAARKGQITKMRNRIANGVCPVPGCKRSGFDNVANHIATVHPDFHAHEAEA